MMERFLLLNVVCIAVGLTNSFDLTILHTNDVHSRFEQFNKYGGPCSEEDNIEGNCYGGAARIYTKVHEIRATDKNVLFLDAGDWFQGTIWFTYYKGLATAYFTNLLGYDAASFGNHEFDDGPEVLATYVKNLTFPIVGCNLDSRNEPSLNGIYSSSVVLEVAGERIGIIGYLTPFTRYLVTSDHVVNLNFTDEIHCLNSEARKLKDSGVNKIIALGHSGFDREIEIAKEVENIDVIIGGHTNTFLFNGDPPSIEKAKHPQYPYVVTQNNGNKVYVVQDYRYGKYLGNLELTFDDDGVIIGTGGNPILLDSSVEQDPFVLSEVERWAIPLLEIRTTVVGQSYVELPEHDKICRFGECNIGNLVTDSILYSQLLDQPEEGGAWSMASAVVYNSGGIRSSLAQGDILLGDLMEVLPFRNEIVGFSLEGRYVLEMLEYSIYNNEEKHGEFLQMSGIHVIYDLTKAPGYRVKEVLIRCSQCSIPKYEPLDMDATYQLVTNTFLIGGGDGYEVLSTHAKDFIPYGITTLEAVRKYVENHSPITHGVEFRIKVLTEADVQEAPPRPSSGVSVELRKWIILVVFVLLQALL